jgi:protein NrfD
MLLKRVLPQAATPAGVLLISGTSLTGVLLLRFFILYAGQLTVV